MAGLMTEAEKYDTTNRDVRRWLNAVTRAVIEAPRWPVLLHCASGKDRTGVAVAVLLRAIGVPVEAVIEEFLLSDGAPRANIEGSLAGVGDPRVYLDRCELRRLSAVLLAVAP